MKRPCLSVLIALLCLLILPVLAENAAFETLPEQIQQDCGWTNTPRKILQTL